MSPGDSVPRRSPSFGGVEEKSYFFFAFFFAFFLAAFFFAGISIHPLSVTAIELSGLI
jgi:hypothetical protein